MSGSFRDAELTGWSTRSVTYDAQLAPVTNQVVSHVLEALGPLSGKQVLDVCCGPGHLAGAIAEAGGAPEGLDFAASMVDRARENYPQLVFRQGDAEALPYGDQTFDHVVCAFGVMHLSRPEAAFAEALRVLRPRGLYIFTQWALDDELLSIVLSAIGRHGEIPTSLPPAPPPLRFSDPLECRRALEITGFTSVADTRIETSWTGERPEALLDLVYGGAVRAAMILEAQTPERRARIHENILAEAKARISGDLIVIRRPSVMAWGTKA